MPAYEFTCSSCEYTFEIFRSFKEFEELEKSKNFKRCPKCKKNKLHQVFYPAHGYVRNTNTLAQLAERNTKKMGKYELEERRRKDKIENVKRRTDALVRNGMLKPDQVDPEKIVDKKPEWYGEMDDSTGKKIFSGTKKEIKKKVRKYVEKGNL